MSNTSCSVEPDAPEPTQAEVDAKLVQYMAQRPDLMEQALASNPEALKGALKDLVQNSAETRQLLGVSGKPRNRRKTDNEAVKRAMMAGGEAQHPEEFLPTPPEHIYYLERPTVDNPEGVRNEAAIRAYQQRWLDGKQYGELSNRDHDLIEQFDENSLGGGVNVPGAMV